MTLELHFCLEMCAFYCEQNEVCRVQKGRPKQSKELSYKCFFHC